MHDALYTEVGLIQSYITADIQQGDSRPAKSADDVQKPQWACGLLSQVTKLREENWK